MRGIKLPSQSSDEEWKLAEPLLPGAAVPAPQKDSAARADQRTPLSGPFCPPRARATQRFLPTKRFALVLASAAALPFQTIHGLALMLDRVCEQREVVPAAGIADSRSVEAPGARECSYAAHKKMIGRKGNSPSTPIGDCLR